MLRYYCIICAAVTASSFITSAAVASTITTEITFDASGVPSNNGATYNTDGYAIGPINKVSGNCEIEDCSGEATSVEQGAFPRIVRTVDPETFSLNSFWFSILGQGNSDDPNYFGVTAKLDGTTVAEYRFSVAGPDGSPAATLLNAYSANDVVVSWVEGETPSNGPASCETTEVCKEFGYRVSLGALSGFQNIDEVLFFADDDANARLDTINLERLAPVPLPAAGFLFLAGLGALGALKRRRSAA